MKRPLPILLAILLSVLCDRGALFSNANAELPSYDRVRILSSPRQVSDVKLTDQNGQAFKLSQLRGSPALLFLGFTNCPDVCPMALHKLRRLIEHGGSDLADVMVVMISVDGYRDSPSVLKSYLDNFSPRFIGLTGEANKVQSVAADLSAAFFKGNVTDQNGSYTVSHSPQVFVIDAHGRLRAEFYNASTEAMYDVMLALLAESNTMHDAPSGRKQAGSSLP